MKAKTLLTMLLIAFGTLLQSCKKSNPTVSDSELKVLKIEDVLNGNDQNLIHLVNKVRGSIGTRGPASKTIWSRKNDFGLGLYVSANHVYGLSTWQNRNAEFFDLHAENPGIFLSSQIPARNGTIGLENMLIADFPFMHFDISKDATNTAILPSEDFYLGIIDNQRAENGMLSVYPTPVQTATSLELFDPAMRTKADQTWNTPVVGSMAVAIGYPQDRASYPNGAVAYGKILSDTEATAMISKLQAAGDPEGNIPYSANVEFFVDAQGLAGMSGGGVFNSEGQLLGIMVRASDQKDAPKIIRVVKISYIRAKMIAFYNTLSEVSKSKVKPFISGEL